METRSISMRVHRLPKIVECRRANISVSLCVCAGVCILVVLDRNTQTHREKRFTLATNWPLNCYKFNAVGFSVLSFASEPISQINATDLNLYISLTTRVTPYFFVFQ